MCLYDGSADECPDFRRHSDVVAIYVLVSDFNLKYFVEFFFGKGIVSTVNNRQLINRNAEKSSVLMNSELCQLLALVLVLVYGFVLYFYFTTTNPTTSTCTCTSTTKYGLPEHTRNVKLFK